MIFRNIFTGEAPKKPGAFCSFLKELFRTRSAPVEEETFRGTVESRVAFALRSLPMAACATRKRRYFNLNIAGQAPGCLLYNKTVAFNGLIFPEYPWGVWKKREQPILSGASAKLGCRIRIARGFPKNQKRCAAFLGMPPRYRELAALLASAGERSSEVSQPRKSFSEEFRTGDPEVSKSAKRNIPIPSLEGKTILVAEDNRINQSVVLRMLEKTGARIVLAEDGLQAVRAVEEEVPDLVLMDLHMPRMDGFEAARIIREMRENLPIIALSAAVMEEDLQRTRDLGMREHLGKPISREILYETLRRHLSSRKVRVLGEEPSSRSEELPEKLPGIDLSRGLAVFGGSGEVYRRALEQFFEEIPQQYKPVLRLLEGGEDERAKRILHTLKGVAGALGAEEIREIAESLEKSLDSPEGASPEMRESFEEALDRVYQAREFLSCQERKISLVGEAEGKNALELLRQNLERSELVDDAVLSGALDFLAERVEKSRAEDLKNLESLVHSFAMEEALELLKGLFRGEGSPE